MTWTVHAVHPDAPDVPIEGEVDGAVLAATLAQVFADLGCWSGYWPTEHYPEALHAGPKP